MHRLLLSLICLLALTACDRSSPTTTSPATPKPLRILCGSSMSGPIQKIVRDFESEYHTTVEVDLGGSETLLPKILAGSPADIFVCHDPFEQKIRGAGKLHDSRPVAVLAPVLCVRPGNPRQISSLQDLTRDGLKIGIGDPRYSTAGELFVNLLDTKGLKAPIIKNVVLQARTHGEIAGGLVAGPLDAVVVWNFVPPMYNGKLQVVPLHETFPPPAPVRVTILALTTSDSPALRDKFLTFATRPTSLQHFHAAGYTPLP